MKTETRKMKTWKCPRCNLFVEDYPAISRGDNKTEICSDCGIEEALIDFKIKQIKERDLKWMN